MALESKKDNVVERLCADVYLPRMFRVRKKLCEDRIKKESIPKIVRSELFREKIDQRIFPGANIGITCGSRGVANIAIITKAIVDFVKEAGGQPFVFPAMGSHGGATVEGQLEVLTGYGVTEEFLGCPIKATMETVQIGTIDCGQPVFVDRYAYQADGIILCGRIKAHTGFRGPYESGLLKMSVIGMGKQHGAESIHELGFATLGRVLPEAARVVFDNCSILAGLAVIENAFDETNRLEVIPGEDIFQREPELLAEAKSKMGKIHIDNVDVLVVDQIGKDISGDGMDPNVTNTYAAPEIMGNETKFHAQRIVVLDLTDNTHGHAGGIGMADVTTKRLVDKIQVDTMYPNQVTATVLCEVKIPMFMHTDKSAIQVALRTCNHIDKTNPRIIRILDTMHLREILVSEALYKEASESDQMEIISEAMPWPFDGENNLRPR